MLINVTNTFLLKAEKKTLIICKDNLPENKFDKRSKLPRKAPKKTSCKCQRFMKNRPPTYIRRLYQEQKRDGGSILSDRGRLLLSCYYY